MIVLPSRYS